MQKKKLKISVISQIHYCKLILRSLLLIAALAAYIVSHLNGSGSMFGGYDSVWIWIAALAIYAVEMVLRCFPSDYESMGCQKQFKKNYIKTGATDVIVHDNNATMLVAIIWIVFNGIFGMLHIMGILDDGIMILLCGAYSICDMICIMFFCPFQSWFMKNKCCSACRIYNWDFAMMFTPLFFVEKTYTWSLLVLSVALLLRWEITFYLHPERFSEHTNAYLKCSNCTEKLCAHKKQLHRLWKQIEEYSDKKLKQLEIK